jgi:hypothetical protein
VSNKLQNVLGEASRVLEYYRLISFQLRNSLPLKEKVVTLNEFFCGAGRHLYNECAETKLPLLLYATL